VPRLDRRRPLPPVPVRRAPRLRRRRQQHVPRVRRPRLRGRGHDRPVRHRPRPRLAGRQRDDLDQAGARPADRPDDPRYRVRPVRQQFPERPQPADPRPGAGGRLLGRPRRHRLPRDPRRSHVDVRGAGLEDDSGLQRGQPAPVRRGGRRRGGEAAVRDRAGGPDGPLLRAAGVAEGAGPPGGGDPGGPGGPPGREVRLRGGRRDAGPTRGPRAAPGRRARRAVRGVQERPGVGRPFQGVRDGVRPEPQRALRDRGAGGVGGAQAGRRDAERGAERVRVARAGRAEDLPASRLGDVGPGADVLELRPRPGLSRRGC